MVSRHLRPAKRGGRIGHIHLPRLNSRKRGILRHKNNSYIFDGRNAAVIIFVGGKQDLFLGSPLHKPVGPGSDRLDTVVFIVGVFRDNAHGSQGI